MMVSVAGMNSAFGFMSDMRPHHFATKFYGREPKTMPECQTIYLKLQTWLLTCFESEFRAKKVLESKTKFPACLHQVCALTNTTRGQPANHL